MKKNQQQEGLEQQQQPSRNKTATQKPMKAKSSMVIRGMSFYKGEAESDEEDEGARGQNSEADKGFYGIIVKAT